MKTINSKIIMTIGIVVMTFSVVLLYRTYTLINSKLMQQIRQQVSLALNFEVSTREYVGETIRPLMFSLLEEGRFIRETMSTSFVARSVFEKVRTQFPDYIIKFAAENPRNPVNQAGAEELNMIRYFNKNPDEQVWAGEIAIGGRQYYAKFQAMRMEQACLRCHGDPANAPRELVEQYGSDTGFFLPLGKIVGLDTIAIPLVKISELLWQETINNFAVIGGALILLFMATTMVFRFVVTDRLRKIADHFISAAKQKEGVRIEPIQVPGKDEITVVADGFNILANKLNNSYQFLETKVRARTAELVNSNELLRIEINERRRTQEELQETLDQLEERVRDRTMELEQLNKELQNEILERKRAEIALRESEEKYSSLVEASLTGVYIIQDDRIVFSNQKYAEIYGYTREEIVGLDPMLLVHPEDRDYVLNTRKARIKGEGAPFEYEIRGLKKNGEIIWVLRSIAIIQYQGRLAIAGNVADTTKRREIEEALRRSEKELRILSAQLLSVEENERKRISNDLHDGIGQALSAIKFSLENALRELAQITKPENLDSLQKLIPLTQETIEEVRRICVDLRPQVIDDLGILATVSWVCREFIQVYSNVHVEKEIDVQENEIPVHLRTAIFRILQEALNNVAKHSKAEYVQLNLQKNNQHIEMILSDNGEGFDLEKALSVSSSRRGVGLASMRERAELSGGKFDIQSVIGEGTTIKVSWSETSVFYDEELS